MNNEKKDMKEEPKVPAAQPPADNLAKSAEAPKFVQKTDDAAKPRSFKPRRQRSGRGPQEEGEVVEEGVSVEVAAVVKAKETSDFVEKVISINRITKVTKGGKKLSFSALVVVGDTKGRVGYSLEKAAEVSIAIKKAIASAKRNMVTIPLNGSTITHEIIGECSGARVLLKPASDGTGVIAAGAVRAVCDGVGIRNILSKCHRSNNPINVVKATFDGLTRLKSHN